jgi:ATP-dependent DNA ligase
VPAFAPSPMLAQLERTLPRGDQWRYEPKIDGFRGLLWHTGGTVIQLLSRNVKELSPWFPELIHAGRTIPPSTVLDGEIVIADDRGCSDFGALHPGARVRWARARRRCERRASRAITST